MSRNLIHCYSMHSGLLIFIFMLNCIVAESSTAAQGSEHSYQPEFPLSALSSRNTIYVGVRGGSIPFSYKKPTKSNEDILIGYGGYIVEVCRSILRQVTTSGPLSNYHVKAVPVTAENRFNKLVSGEVDMLCGPDSITTARLHKYNVSHPIFLSGIAVAKVPIDKLPKSSHCGPVVGVVKGTTSQFAGLQAAIDAGAFDVRFGASVRAYLLSASGESSEPEVDHLGKLWKKFATEFVKQGSKSKFIHAGVNGYMPSTDIKTPDDCAVGYSAGPVILYESHDKGIGDLCAGNIFFYLGDVDIIKRKVPESCDVSISRQTFTKEAYGIYFRKFKTVISQTTPVADIYDAVLYSEFNNVLLTQMQDSENVLQNQYVSEFGDSRMAVDLESFFRSFQYATNY